MAVEIPRVQRFEAPTQPSVGRSNVQAPNLAAEQAPALQGVGQAIQTGTKAFEAYEAEIRKREINAWDIKTTELNNTFQMRVKEALAKTRLKDGDTTADYVQLDEDMARWEEELFNFDGQPMRPEMAEILQRKISNTKGAMYGLRNIQQAEQNYKWRRSVVNTAVKLNQDNMLEAGFNVDVTRPETFLVLEQFRDAIRDSRIAEGDERGILKRDENGVPLWTEGEVANEIRRDMGGAIVPLVTALNNAGKVAEAKKLIEDYGPLYLNASTRAKLSNDNDEANVKNQALAELAKMGPNPTIAQIMGSKNSEEVKQKMRDINHTRGIQEAAEMSEKRAANFNRYWQQIYNLQQTKNKFVTVSQLKDSPGFKNFANLATPEQIKKVTALVEGHPEVSDIATMEKFYGMLRDNTFAFASNEDLAEFRKNLNARDWRSVESTFKTIGRADTTTQSLSFKSNALKDFRNKVNQSIGSDDRQLFPRSRNNPSQFRDGEDQRLVNIAERKIEEYISNNPKITEPQLRELVDRTYNELLVDKEKSKKSWFNVGKWIDGFKNGFLGESDDEPPVLQQTVEPVEGNQTSPTITPAPTQQPAPRPTGSTSVPSNVRELESAWLNDPANSGKTLPDNRRERAKALAAYRKKLLSKGN